MCVCFKNTIIKAMFKSAKKKFLFIVFLIVNQGVMCVPIGVMSLHRSEVQAVESLAEILIFLLL